MLHTESRRRSSFSSFLPAAPVIDGLPAPGRLACEALERARGRLLYRGITPIENHDLQLAVRRRLSAPDV
jgi:hypothetical protein